MTIVYDWSYMIWSHMIWTHVHIWFEHTSFQHFSVSRYMTIIYDHYIWFDHIWFEQLSTYDLTTYDYHIWFAAYDLRHMIICGTGIWSYAVFGIWSHIWSTFQIIYENPMGWVCSFSWCSLKNKRFPDVYFQKQTICWRKWKRKGLNLRYVRTMKDFIWQPVPWSV